MELSIIIPHRGNPLGLWATVHSCQADLERAGKDYNFVIVTNGEKVSLETESTIKFLKDEGRLKEHLHFDEPVAPPAARQRGAAVADGRLLCFFDNHCLVGRQYFERAILDFERGDIDSLHSTTVFYNGQGRHYHYRLKLKYNFWGESVMIPYHEFKPYHCAAGGHGGFIVKRSVWEEVGGYGPEELLQGYGGEELMFDLKLWRWGKKVAIDPKVVHYHYTGDRGYSRHYTDEYYVNLMVSAMVVGGQKWLDVVHDSLATPGRHLRLRARKNIFDLYQEAYNRAAQYSHDVDAKSVMDLDELLKWFRQTLVAH